MTLDELDIICASKLSSGKDTICKNPQLSKIGSKYLYQVPSDDTWMSRPPRPPCWHDFLSRSHRASAAAASAGDEFTDLSQELKSAEASSDPGGNNGHGVVGVESRPKSRHHHHRHHHHHHKHSKKPKHRLHRTQSEFSIDQCDLPSMDQMTRTLADAKPRELGLRRRTLDTRLYLDENNRRCERWLAGVHASRPLDDIAFAQGTGVELEIPEETWEDLEQLQKTAPPHNSSASNSDSDEGQPRARRLTTSSSPAALGLSHLLIKKPQIQVTPPGDTSPSNVNCIVDSPQELLEQSENHTTSLEASNQRMETCSSCPDSDNAIHPEGMVCQQNDASNIGNGEHRHTLTPIDT